MMSEAFPNGWSTAVLQDKFDFTKKPRALKFDDYLEIPFVPMEFVPQGPLCFSKFNLKSPSDISSGTYFEPNDLLLSKITPSFENGKQGIIQELPTPFGIATTEVIPIKGRVGESDIRFLAFYLVKDNVRKWMTGKMEGSTGRQRLPLSLVKNLELPFPPFIEQRSIVAVLSKIQEAIAAQQEVIDRTRELKKSLMTMLFTRGLRGEPTKETEIGLVPESWEVKPMIDAVEIEYGIQAAVAHNLDSSIGTPILTNVNISFEGELRLDKIRYYPITEKNKNKILKKNDILFNWRSGSQEHVGKTAIFDLEGEYTFSSFILRLCTRDSFIPHFVFYYLTWLREDGFFVRKHQYSINAKFNASEAARTPIVCPTIKEQNEIADILSVTVGKLKIEESKMNHLQDLFKAVLHELMTGSIRTTPLMEA